MTIKIIQKKSPNFDKRPKGTKINSIIIHYTGMKTFHEAYERLCDKNSKVSAVFTNSKTIAEPVKWSKKNINNDIRAIVVNSGNANALTGKKGYDLSLIHI